MSYKKLVAACLLMLIGSPGHSTEIVHNPNINFKLGRGYDSQNSKKKAECLEPIIENQGYSEGTLGIVSEISQYHLAESLGMAAGGVYRTGATTTSASAVFMRNTEKSGHSLSLTYTADYAFAPRSLKTRKWTPLAKDFLTPIHEGNPIDPGPDGYSEEEWKGAVIAKNPERFFEKCGDEFVDEQSIGAKFFYNIRIDFVSENDKRTVGANFSFSSPTTDVEASFLDKMEKVSKRTHVTVSALQIGGSIDKLGAIFGQDLMNDGTGAKAMVSCSGGDYKSCFEVLQNAIAYANDINNGFPSTISPSLNEPGKGPAILSSRTVKYLDEANLVDTTAPETAALIKESRKTLSSIFEELYEVWIQSKRMQETGLPRLDIAQSETRLAIETASFRRLKDLTANYIQVCYFDIQKCGNAVTEEVIAGFRNDIRIYKSRLEKELLTPKRFAAICDLHYAGELSYDIANTVEAMIEAVDKPINQGGVEYWPIRESKDLCAAAEVALAESSSLDLSNQEITNLSPLFLVKHIRELDLSGNRINSIELERLAPMENLEILKLGKNLIRKLDHFPKLTRLKRLYLNNNRLKSFGNLVASAPQLTYLNLSNTDRNLQCPYPAEDSVCVMRDYARYTSFTESLRSRHARVGSSLIDLNSRYILVAGGVGQTKLELIDKTNLSLKEIPRTSLNSHGSTYTSIEDNRVFVFGGEDAEPETSAFVMNFEENGNVLKSDLISFRGPVTYEHKALLMGNGKVLVTGGYNSRYTNQATAAAYVFDPVHNKIETIGGMNVPRVNHTMSLLQDGRVLIIGGNTLNAAGKAIPNNTVEVFDPETNSFSWYADRMISPRFGHSSVVLQNGDVLVTGGFTAPTASVNDTAVESDTKYNTPTNTAEILTADGSVFEVLFKQAEPRAFHKAVVLESGNVALFGGINKYVSFSQGQDECFSCLKTSEIYDPAREDFTDTGKLMSAGRTRFDLMPLRNNRVLILGGPGKAQYSTEIFSYNGL